MKRDTPRPTLLYLVTEDWYFCSHRLALARAAAEQGYRVVVVTRVRDHAAPILEAGIELEHLSLERRSVNPLSALRALAALIGIYREVRPAIVHHVALKPVVLGTLAALVSGVPRVVNTIAGLGFVFASTSMRARVLRPMIRTALALVLSRPRVTVVVQNDVDAAEVERLRVPRERIAIVRGSGVDIGHFVPTPEPPPPVVVSVVARMLVDKGIGELVSAARELRARSEPVEVELVGAPDADNPSSIDEATLRAWHRDGVVRWRGATEDVASVWARSHIAVLPSYREGLPKSLLEAAACGRAMIATDVPGCRDVVLPGETGLLVPPRDAGALADAIATLARAPELRARFGRAARELVVERFSQAQVVAETLALYRRLGARPPTA